MLNLTIFYLILGWSNMGRRTITVIKTIAVDGELWRVQVALTTPSESDRDLEPIKAEIVKRLPSWIKSKIEKG